MNAAKRKLHLGLRKQVKVTSRFQVAHVGDGVIRWTCLQCGRVTTEQVYEASDTGRALADKWVRYITHPEGKGTAGGVCEGCTKLERDRRYPLQ